MTQDIEQTGYDYANRLNLYKKGTGTVASCVPTFSTTATHYTYLAAPTGDRFMKTNVLATGGTIAAYRYVADARDAVADYEKLAAGARVVRGTGPRGGNDNITSVASVAPARPPLEFLYSASDQEHQGYRNPSHAEIPHD